MGNSMFVHCNISQILFLWCQKILTNPYTKTKRGYITRRKQPSEQYRVEKKKKKKNAESCEFFALFT